MLPALFSRAGTLIVPAAFLIGLAAGAWPAYKIGHSFGFGDGKREAEQAAVLQAEVDRLRNDLETAQHDRMRAEAQVERMRLQAAENAQAASDAQEQLDAYARFITSLGPDSACGLSDDDVRWLREGGPPPASRHPAPPAAPGRDGGAGPVSPPPAGGR